MFLSGSAMLTYGLALWMVPTCVLVGALVAAGRRADRERWLVGMDDGILAVTPRGRACPTQDHWTRVFSLARTTEAAVVVVDLSEAPWHDPDGLDELGEKLGARGGRLVVVGAAG